MNTIIEQIRNSAIVPVVVLENKKDAIPVAKALQEGGIYCAEITFRTTVAASCISIMKEAYPDMLVGAGTVLNKKQVDAALEAGAEFIVSPGFDPEMVRYCQEKKVLVIPGITSPSEVTQAYAMGLQVVKFFPAEASGGLAMIKAMAGPFPEMMFMPTGGINAENISGYLEFQKIIACGGSWMVDKKLIREEKFEEITRLSREAVNNILGFQLAHIGITGLTEGCAASVTDQFCKIFGFDRREKTESFFAGTAVEVMKTAGLGEKGHIAIGTKHVVRAKYYLEKKGILFDESTVKYKNGEMTCVYLKEQIAGFAVHLVKVS